MIGTKFGNLKIFDFSLIFHSRAPPGWPQKSKLAQLTCFFGFSKNRGGYIETEDRYQKSVLQIFYNILRARALRI